MITHYINTLIQVMGSPFGIVMGVLFLLSILWGLYEIWVAPTIGPKDQG